MYYATRSSALISTFARCGLTTDWSSQTYIPQNTYRSWISTGSGSPTSTFPTKRTQNRRVTRLQTEACACIRMEQFDMWQGKYINIKLYLSKCYIKIMGYLTKEGEGGEEEEYTRMHIIDAQEHRFITEIMFKQTSKFTRKLCCRKDDRAMRPIYGCPEFSGLPGYYSQHFYGLLFRWSLWIFLQNLKSVALPVPGIIGGTQKIWAVPGYAHAPSSP